MAIIINKMTKPTSCWRCPFLTEEEWRCLACNRHVYNIEQPLPSWCPIEAVVKCKECVHYEPDRHYTCVVMDWTTDEHGYCSRGETDER